MYTQEGCDDEMGNCLDVWSGRKWTSLVKRVPGIYIIALSKVFLIFLSEHGTFCVGWFAIRKIKIISSV